MKCDRRPACELLSSVVVGVSGHYYENRSSMLLSASAVSQVRSSTQYTMMELLHTNSFTNVYRGQTETCRLGTRFGAHKQARISFILIHIHNINSLHTYVYIRATVPLQVCQALDNGKFRGVTNCKIRTATIAVVSEKVLSCLA